MRPGFQSAAHPVGESQTPLPHSAALSRYQRIADPSAFIEPRFADYCDPDQNRVKRADLL